MHGQLSRLRCVRCGHTVETLENTDPDTFEPCPKCEYPRLRPDIVWFGEMPYHLDEIQQRVASCQYFLSIGTSGVVYPAAGLLSVARAAGAKTWVNSLDLPENVDPADRFVSGRAADVIPQMVDTWLSAGPSALFPS